MKAAFWMITSCFLIIMSSLIVPGGDSSQNEVCISYWNYYIVLSWKRLKSDIVGPWWLCGRMHDWWVLGFEQLLYNSSCSPELETWGYNSSDRKTLSGWSSAWSISRQVGLPSYPTSDGREWEFTRFCAHACALKYPAHQVSLLILLFFIKQLKKTTIQWFW